MTNPLVLPGCTDYSPYSLDQLWAMISPADTVSQTQIDGWLSMAILCQDQADTLTRALANLADHWPPTKGSASESFSSVVNVVISTMNQNASEAQSMSRALSDIVGTLDAAKAHMQTVMDQRARFQQISEPSEFPDIAAARLAPHAPDGWQADLHQQATAIMASADARIESIAWAMPSVTAVAGLPIDTQGHSGGGGSNGHTGQTGLNRGRLPLFATGPLPITSDTAVEPANIGSSTLDPLRSEPMLAGESVSDPAIQPRVDSFQISGSAHAPYASTGVILTPGLPSGGSPGLTPQVNSVSDATATGVDEHAQATTTAGMLPPSMGTRPPSAPGRTGSRPGGRAAIWYSQRQKKPDSKDPWSVRRGIPPIIEAPPEPTDHDPGPGVIGIDA